MRRRKLDDIEREATATPRFRAAAALVIAVTAAIATTAPALHATRVDPAVTFRTD